jgi:hypothetical protein
MAPRNVGTEVRGERCLARGKLYVRVCLTYAYDIVPR